MKKIVNLASRKKYGIFLILASPWHVFNHQVRKSSPSLIMGPWRVHEQPRWYSISNGSNQQGIRWSKYLFSLFAFPPPLHFLFNKGPPSIYIEFPKILNESILFIIALLFLNSRKCVSGSNRRRWNSQSSRWERWRSRTFQNY